MTILIDPIPAIITVLAVLLASYGSVRFVKHLLKSDPESAALDRAFKALPRVRGGLLYRALIRDLASGRMPGEAVMTAVYVTLKSLGTVAGRCATLLWLTIPKHQRDEVAGDFWATLDEAKRRGVGSVGRKCLAALVLARYACVVLWFLVYRVLKVLVLLSKLGSAS